MESRATAIFPDKSGGSCGLYSFATPEVSFTADQFNLNAPLSAWKPFESRQTAVQEGSGQATVLPSLQACEATRQLWSSQRKTLGNPKLSNPARG